MAAEIREKERERERGVKEREGGEERKKKEEVLGMVFLMIPCCFKI